MYADVRLHPQYCIYTIIIGVRETSLLLGGAFLCCTQSACFRFLRDGALLVDRSLEYIKPFFFGATCSGGEQEADFAHVARVFGRMLSARRYVDVVATDVAAGLILLRHVQKAEVCCCVHARVRACGPKQYCARRPRSEPADHLLCVVLIVRHQSVTRRTPQVDAHTSGWTGRDARLRMHR